MKRNCNNINEYFSALDDLEDNYFDAKELYEKEKKEEYLKKVKKYEIRIENIVKKHEEFIEKYVCEYCVVFPCCRFNDLSCEKYGLYWGACEYVSIIREMKECDSDDPIIIIKTIHDFYVIRPRVKDTTDIELQFHYDMLNIFESLPYFKML